MCYYYNEVIPYVGVKFTSPVVVRMAMKLHDVRPSIAILATSSGILSQIRFSLRTRAITS